MRGGKESGPEGFRLEQRVQLARGHWRREEQAGAVRSMGWWESVTVTWSPAASPPRRSPLLHRALVTAVDAIAPSLAELAVVGARHLLGRRSAPRAVPSSSRRPLPAAIRALPRARQHP